MFMLPCIIRNNELSREELEDILCNAPDWWGTENKEIYDNLIFIMPPATFAEVYSEIGEPKEELEKIKDYVEEAEKRK